MVNNFIGQFGEDYQQAFDAIFVKGVDPKEYFGTYNNIKSFAEMDLADESNQVALGGEWHQRHFSAGGPDGSDRVVPGTEWHQRRFSVGESDKSDEVGSIIQLYPRYLPLVATHTTQVP